MSRAVHPSRLLALCLLAGTAASPSWSGLVVEEVRDSGLPEEELEVRVGDVLVSWESIAAGARGTLDSPFAVRLVQAELSARGPVTFRGHRQGEPFEAQLPSGVWWVLVRPDFRGDSLARYLAAVDQHEKGEIEAGARAWVELATEVQDPGKRAWLLWRAARALDRDKEWEEAKHLYDQLERASEQLAPRLRALLGFEIGNAHGNRGYLDVAAARFEAALAILIQEGRESMLTAHLLNGLGRMAGRRGDVDAAEAFFRRAAAIKGALAPGSLSHAAEIMNLGVVARDRGDLPAAEEQYRRSLAIFERASPEGVEVASALNNLGSVAWRRGDLAAAEELFRRSLAIRERLEPESLNVARLLENLGLVAWDRGDLRRAEDFFQRALALKEQWAPGTLHIAQAVANLGGVSWENGDLDIAQERYERALAIRQELAPDSMALAGNLGNLGNVALDRGDLSVARVRFQESLEVFRRQAPDSLKEAWACDRLGEVTLAEGEAAAAERWHRRAATLRQTLAPDSWLTAESLHHLARTVRVAGRLVEAEELFERAVQALETQLGRLGGGDDTRAVFRARHFEVYRDWIDLLLEREAPDEAFRVLERSRARSFLALLAERELVWSADVPLDLERERRTTAVEYDGLLAQLAELSPQNDPIAVQEVSQQLAELRDRRLRLNDRVRALSPRLAALESIAPLRSTEVAEVVPPGTLVLSYLVGKDETLLFALPPDGPLSVSRLALGEGELRAQVGAFRGLLEHPGKAADDLQRVRSAGRRLYDRLLSPVAPALASAQRLLIVPDGSLHLLPFSALITDGGRYLVEAKPLQVVVSLTVYAELRRRSHRPPAAAVVVAFADPGLGGPDGSGAPTIRAPVRAPLPAARQEVAALSRAFSGPTETWFGEEATEDRVKRLTGDLTVLHFATHAVVDERSPLESGLYLAPGGRHFDDHADGFLQAWEILEELRFEAGLITLSACNTALGSERTGEGIIGLTRAFHYAGARAVLSSLWEVADATTASLMEQFYRNAAAGAPLDEALRQAQLHLIAGPIDLPPLDADGPGWFGWVRRLFGSDRFDASHPFYWAAFQLHGDAGGALVGQSSP